MVRLGAAALGAVLLGAAALPSSGFDPKNLDPACPACTNFFQYATGGWRKTNPIPPAYSTWGQFDTLQERNREVLHGLLEADARDSSAAADSETRKLGTYYATCLASNAVENAGTAPLADELATIDAIADRAGLIAEIAHLQKLGVLMPFAYGSSPDAKNAAQIIAEIDQSGLGLPDRDYYTKTDAATAAIRVKYRAHLAAVFALAGDDAPTAAAEAAAVVAFETRLARAQFTRVQLRDPVATYHKLTLAQLRGVAPHVDWSAYVTSVDSPAVASLNVSEPTYLKTADAAIADAPLASWKTYARWQLFNTYGNTLGKAWVTEAFRFYGTTLQGTKEQLPAWKRCVSAVDGALGDALGKQYVATAFTPADRARALALVNNLQSVLHDDLATLPWMSPKTRAFALVKLAAYAKKIGYTAKWRDYSAFTADPASYTVNAERAAQVAWAIDMHKIGKPRDPTQWDMTPPTVNAYYDPERNEIVFPAGILQPPFFNPAADDAVNYGAIGMVIGHEMTHGFDDQGRQFDAKGNLVDWWTKADAANFKRRANCIAREFDGFSVVPGVHENGQLVQGEAIADLGGLTIAYRAFERTAEARSAAKIDGFTPAQRFFLGFAQVWAETDRPEVSRLYAATDPHPAPAFRVNGTVANMPAFAAAFACRRNAAMVRPPAQRCEIW
ncbi:MAG: M13 family metallopeptidase [Candidatus Velthaea sp.]